MILHTTVPNTFPIPAVSAIAKAPQKVTRAAARRMFAPPAFAPMAPRKARKPRDADDTIGTSAPAGETTTMSKGIAAPTAKVAEKRARIRPRAEAGTTALDVCFAGISLKKSSVARADARWFSRCEGAES